LQQLVAGAAQLGPYEATAGAAQVGAALPQPLFPPPQKLGLQRRIFGKQSFGSLIRGMRGPQPLLQPVLQPELQLVATGAQAEATGAQVAAGAAQEGP